MSINDRDYAFPDAAPNFSIKEKNRLNKNFAKLQERLRATCRHLIKADGPVVKKRARWNKVQFKHYLDSSRAASDAVILVPLDED